MRSSTRLKLETDVNLAVVERLKQLAFANHEEEIRALLRDRSCRSEEVALAVAGLVSENEAALNFLHPVLSDYHHHIDRVTEVYAGLNKPALVDVMLNEYNADVNAAVSGYAAAGLWMRVNPLLSKRGGDTGAAIYAYARAGHVIQVEKLVDQNITQYASFFISGFKDGGFFDTQENVLRLFSQIDSAAIRNTLRMTLERKFPSEADKLLEKAAAMKAMRREYQMSFEQCRDLFDQVKVIEAKHQPSFFGYFFAEDASKTQRKIHEEVMVLLGKHLESAHSVVSPNVL